MDYLFECNVAKDKLTERASRALSCDETDNEARSEDRSLILNPMSSCSSLTSAETIWWTVGVFALALTVYVQGWYFNSFRNGFHMDDVVAIQKNQDVVGPGPIDWFNFLRHDFWGLDMFSGEWTHKSFRPLVTLSYRINWLLSCLDSNAYHVTNILLHGLVSSLTFLLCRKKLSMNLTDSAAVSILFAVHPVHTESLLYLVGRADILCAVFFLFALLLYPSRPYMTYMAVLFAGLSKELGFMAFPVLCIHDFLTLERPSKYSERGRLIQTLVVGVIMMWIRHWYTDGTELKMSPQDNPIAFEVDPISRRISYSIIHGEYGRLLVFPYFLCYDYSLNTIPVASWLDDIRLLSPLTAYSAFALACWFATKRRNHPIILGLSIFVLTFIPMSNILFPVGTVVGERLLYIPSLGYLIVLVLSIPPKMREQTIAILIILFTARTILRVDDWKTANNLTLVDGFVNPKSAKTQYNLGVQYFTKQRYDEAALAFRRSFETDPLQRDGVAFWRAGQAELLRGNLQEAERLLVAATSKYGAKLMVREEEIFHDAGVALYHNGKVDSARYHLSAALTLNRKFPKALNNMGCLLVGHGDINIGLSLIQEASALKPRNVIYSGNVWIVATKLGRLELAEGARNHTLGNQASFVPANHCVWEFKPAEGGPADSAMND